MAFFVVNKIDLKDRSELADQLGHICESKTETEDCIIFEPKAGFLVSVGTMLAENKVSYQLEFEPPYHG
jgi:hypothetical protein